MDTHSMIFVTIDNLVSPSSSVSGTHWIIFVTIDNLVSPPSFPFTREVRGRT